MRDIKFRAWGIIETCNRASYVDKIVREWEKNNPEPDEYRDLKKWRSDRLDIVYKACDDWDRDNFSKDRLKYAGRMLSWDDPLVCEAIKNDTNRRCADGSTIVVKRDHVMQYTGLKDKNGVEIYEGDIVDQSPYKPSMREIRRFAIVWRNAGLRMERVNNDIAGITVSGYADLYQYAGQRLTVIGNIYEDPELLEDM